VTASRPERLAEALRSEISVLIRREIRDPRIGFVTLTGATVSPDLSHARVYVTVLGPEPKRAQSVDALNRAAGYLQRILFKQLRLRKNLRLTFILDESGETGSRIEELLDRIHRPAGSEEE
jgi:ribosome-binding factor A